MGVSTKNFQEENPPGTPPPILGVSQKNRLRRQKSIGFQNFRRASRVKSLQFTLRILEFFRASRGKVLKSRFTLEISRTKKLALRA